jgi:hypothetical protein
MLSRIHASLGSLVRVARNSLLCIAIPALVFAGNDFWNQKDFSQWSQNDVQKLLVDSPWSKKESWEYVGYTDHKGMPYETIGGSEAYLVQLRSAKPIRQAIIRVCQLQMKNGTLSPDMKLQLKNKMRDYLSAKNPDEVIVHVSVFSPDPAYILYWQSQTTDTLKDFVFLIGEKGVKIPIKRFVLGDELPQLERWDIYKGGYQEKGGEIIPNIEPAIEFEFIFPRRLESRKILVAGDKTLQLEFVFPVKCDQHYSRWAAPDCSDGKHGEYPIKKDVVKFNASKMIFRGKLTY